MTTSGRKDKTVEELENILFATEPNEQLRRTLVELCSTLEDVAKECSDPSNPLYHRDEKGLFVYLNYKEGSKLHVNGKNATFFTEAYSIYEQSGKQMMREMVGEDGALEYSIDGKLKSGRRKLGSDNYDEVAVQKGLIKKGEEVSAAQLRFDEKARKKKVFCKHYSGKTATGIDSNIYVIILSSTGEIVVMHDYKNVYSTISSEIDPEYRQYLASNTSDANKNSSVKGADVIHHKVQETGVISPNDLKIMGLSMLYERRLCEHHF